MRVLVLACARCGSLVDEGVGKACPCGVVVTIARDMVADADIASLLLRLKFNVHPVLDAVSQRRVGLGLYPAACYLNHSCDPNAVAHTVNGGSIIVFRSIRPIPVGTPVTYSYIDLYQDRPARQKLLSSGYMFSCEVRKCQRLHGGKRDSPGARSAFAA